MDSKEILCPFCGESNVKKNGKRDGKQRYYCFKCNKIFLETTKTIFSSTKLTKDQLKQLIILVIDDTKIETIMDVLSISSRTAYMWRMKIYKEAGEIIKNNMLSNTVWIDEKLVPVNKKYLVTKPNGLKYRGQSKNQIVIACAIDSNGNKYAEIVGKGHVSSKQCLNSYGKHIKPGSYIIHDGIFAHDKLIKFLKSNDEIWKSVVKESKKHMQPINSFCSEIERNLVIHMGSRSENLQDYLNWIVYKSAINSENINGKVAELECKCFQFRVTYRIKDRYNRKKSATFL